MDVCSIVGRAAEAEARRSVECGCPRVLLPLRLASLRLLLLLYSLHLRAPPPAQTPGVSEQLRSAHCARLLYSLLAARPAQHRRGGDPSD